jgi:hypothetical protein
VSSQAALIEAVGLTQWRAPARRTLGRCGAQRRLRVCGGQRHLVPDARRGAQEVPGCGEDGVAGASASRVEFCRDARGLAAAGHVLGRRRAPALPVRRHVRSRAQRVRAAAFACARGRGRPRGRTPGRGAGCAAAVAVPQCQWLQRPRRAAIAHGVVTVNLATHAQVRLDARLRARDGPGVIEPAARRVCGRDGDRGAPGGARAGRGRRLRSMSGRCRCATAVPRGLRRSASCGRRAGR